jgi:hypothetical protein
VCPVYKGKPFKLDDRPPLLTDIEISYLETIVNGSFKSGQVQVDSIPKKAVVLYDFLRSFFAVYVTYNVCRNRMDVYRL